jgi:hypothetical protein
MAIVETIAGGAIHGRFLFWEGWSVQQQGGYL